MLAHYAVPTVAITLVGWGSYQIAQRQYLLDNVNADFVRTARAKGLTRNQAISRHALRVSFIPVAQSIAFTIPAIFAGGFFAEKIFAWPGVGFLEHRRHLAAGRQRRHGHPRLRFGHLRPRAPSWRTSPPRLLTRE